MSHKPKPPKTEEMRKRTITLEDGRYMIFYEFGDEIPAAEKAQTDTETPSKPSENV